MTAIIVAAAICAAPSTTTGGQTASSAHGERSAETRQLGAFGRGATLLDAAGTPSLQGDASWFYVISTRGGQPATTLAMFREPDGSVRKVFSDDHADEGEAAAWLRGVVSGLDLDLPTIAGEDARGRTWSRARVRGGHHAHRMRAEEAFAVWVTGSIELGGDRQTIERAGPNSSFILLHQNGADAPVRFLDLSSTADGGMVVRYARDGRSAPLDAEARLWLAELLPRLDDEGLLAIR